MSWYTVFYLMSVADSIGTFSFWIALLATIIFIISSLIKMPADLSESKEKWVETEQEKKNLNSVWRIATTCMVFFWFLFIAIPERKDMVLIVAGGTIGNFLSNDEDAQKLPSEFVVYLRKEILEATVDLPEEVAKQIKEELKIETKEDILDELKEMSIDELKKLKDNVGK